MTKTLTTLCLAAVLTACASGDYKAYLAAQQQAIRDAQVAQKPLIRIEAEPGQPITGLRSIEVYAPQSGQAAVIQQPRPSEWIGAVTSGIQVLGVVAGIKYTGQAAVNLADSVGRSANYGYQYINPTPVIAPDPVIVQQPAPVIVQPTVVQPTVVRPEIIVTP